VTITSPFLTLKIPDLSNLNAMDNFLDIMVSLSSIVGGLILPEISYAHIKL